MNKDNSSLGKEKFDDYHKKREMNGLEELVEGSF